MKDDESIQDFHMTLLDIANSFEALEKRCLMRNCQENFLDLSPKDLI
jgi:hypothetical protein